MSSPAPPAPAPPAPAPSPPAPSPPAPAPPAPSPPAPAPEPRDEAAELRAALEQERDARKRLEADLAKAQQQGMSEQERAVAEAKAAGRPRLSRRQRSSWRLPNSGPRQRAGSPTRTVPSRRWTWASCWAGTGSPTPRR